MTYPGQPRPLTPEEVASQARTLQPEEANPCLLLPAMRTALYRLMAGDSRAKVAFAGHNGTHRETIYHPGDVKQLRAEIRRLEILCDPADAHGRAVRAGPVEPHGSFGLRRGPYPFR